MRRRALALLLGFSAQGSRAAESASFLTIGVGARALGMGGAYTALAEDSGALYWNPAGLARLEKREAGAGHAELFEGARLDYLAYAHPTAEGVFSGGATYLSQKRLDGRDSLGRPTGGFGAARGLTLGAGFKDERWELSYAVMPMGELGSTHRVSLGARW